MAEYAILPPGPTHSSWIMPQAHKTDMLAGEHPGWPVSGLALPGSPADAGGGALYTLAGTPVKLRG